jgi:hypothetical protein
MAHRERRELAAAIGEIRVRGEDEPACPKLGDRREQHVEFAFGARLQGAQLQAEAEGGLRQIPDLRVRGRTGRVHGHHERSRARDELAHELQALARDLHAQAGNPGEIASRPRQAGNETEPDGISPQFEDDRDGFGCRFCRERHLRAARRDDHGHALAYEIQRQLRQAAILPLGPAKRDGDIAALDETRLGEAFTERLQPAGIGLGRFRSEIADHRHRWLRAGALCQDHCTADKRKDIATPRRSASVPMASGGHGTHAILPSDLSRYPEALGQACSACPEHRPRGGTAKPAKRSAEFRGRHILLSHRNRKSLACSAEADTPLRVTDCPASIVTTASEPEVETWDWRQELKSPTPSANARKSRTSSPRTKS